MHCPKCNTDLAVFVTTHKDLKIHAEYCNKCQVLYTGGMAIPLLDIIKGKLNSVLAEAKQCAAKAAEDIKKDPDLRIEKYFERVFISAFTQAFCSVFNHFKNDHREGRLVRIRELWEKIGILNVDADLPIPTRTEIEELDALIRMK